MSLQYLKEAVASNENEKLIRYVRLHLGDGNEAAGRKEIDKAWVEALKLLLDVPPTDREFILGALNNHTPATLAHHHFGVPFHRELQRRIIIAALDHLVNARQSAEIHCFPMTWARARQEGKAIEGLA